MKYLIITPDTLHVAPAASPTLVLDANGTAQPDKMQLNASRNPNFYWLPLTVPPPEALHQAVQLGISIVTYVPGDVPEFRCPITRTIVIAADALAVARKIAALAPVRFVLFHPKAIRDEAHYHELIRGFGQDAAQAIA